jgi:hypothetical protein
MASCWELLVEAAPTFAHPPLHLHPHQEERMDVLSGTLGYRL